MRLVPFLTVDLETTGVPSEDFMPQILQLAAVWADGDSPLGNLLKLNLLIQNPEPLTGGHYALSLNKWILDEVIAKPEKKKTDIPVVSLDIARTMFHDFVEMGMQTYGLNKVTPAGKNYAGFDGPILKGNHFGITNSFTHRVIDPGSMYLKHFGYVPSMDEINKLTGRNVVSHNAIEDCLDVIVAVRKDFENGRK